MKDDNSTESYTIDSFKESDQMRVQEFGFDISFCEMGQKYDPKMDDDWKDIDGYYIKTGGAFFVVRAGKEIAGCGGVKKIDNFCAELRRLRLKKEYRGKGIGKALFEKQMSFAKENGFKKVVLDTTNDAVRHLCDKYGFKLTKQRGGNSFYEKDI